MIKVGDHRVGHFYSGSSVMVITKTDWPFRVWYKWVGQKGNEEEYCQTCDELFKSIYEPISKEEVIKLKLKDQL